MNTDVKPAELTLVNGADTIVIRPRQAHAGNPIMCKSWDLGAPDVRYTTVPNPGADGVTESNGYIGSRTVRLELQIVGGKDPLTGEVHDAYWYAQKLTQMVHPKASPVLTISRSNELTWRMALRGDPYSMPFTRRSASILDLTMSFVCPLGLIEGPLREVTTPASGGGQTDVDFPFAFPFTFGLSGALYPQVSFTVGGDSPVAPIIYISGPVKDPEVVSGEDRFAFDGLTLAAGQTVQIDNGTGNIRLGDADSRQILDDMSAYNTVDWAVSNFWSWQPGARSLRFYSQTGSVTVQFRERILTI